MKETLRDLLERRSCRKYLPEQIKDEELAAVLEAGTFAPSGMNRQLNHFIIVTDPKTLAEITRMVSEKLPAFAGKDCRYGAPALVVVANRKSNGVALQDAACAMENMMLAAASLGVASRWINQPYALTDDPELRALLGIEEEERICASLSLGLPAGPLFPGRKDHPGNPISWITGE